MYSSDRTASQRWGSKDLRPGSAFHELVALPTFLPAAARPYQLPGMRPGASALDNSPWAQPFLQSVRSANGMIFFSSESPLAYMYIDLGAGQDGLTSNSTEQVLARPATTPPNSTPTVVTDNMPTMAGPMTAEVRSEFTPIIAERAIFGPSATPQSRVRFIEPILIPPQPPQETLPNCHSPSPVEPEPSQDFLDLRGTLVGHLTAL